MGRLPFVSLIDEWVSCNMWVMKGELRFEDGTIVGANDHGDARSYHMEVGVNKAGALFDRANIAGCEDLRAAQVKIADQQCRMHLAACREIIFSVDATPREELKRARESMLMDAGVTS